MPKGGIEPPFPRPQRGVLTTIRLELLFPVVVGWPRADLPMWTFGLRDNSRSA